MKDEYISMPNTVAKVNDEVSSSANRNSLYDNEEVELVKTWLDKVDTQIVDRVEEDERVKDPSHYTDVPEGYEHHRVMDAIGSNYHFSNAMKYLWRAGKKSSKGMTIEDKEIQDVRKSIRYLEMWIEIRQEDETKRGMNDFIE